MLKVFGHKNPDTDTITSAIVLADLLTAQGQAATPYRLGDLNKETTYVLNHFNVEVPELLKSVDESDTVALVDHNEFGQSVDGIEKATPYMVVDHHRVSGFSSAEPLFFRVEPVGCTATLLYKMYEENNIEIKPEIAGLMASAIISDSLLFKSPTCTPFDKETCLKLAEIAKIDVETYGLDMLKAGADVSDLTAEQILNVDAKGFKIGDANLVVGQVNTVDIESIMARKAELEQVMNEKITSEGLDVCMLVVTDIMNSHSEAIVLGEKTENIGKAFGATLTNNGMLLPGVVSRKKQIVPVLEKALG